MAAVKMPSSDSTAKSIELNLFVPGMTALHRVGLAGLWMTLRKFEKEKKGIPGGSWKLTDESVTLSWNDGPRRFFESLFQESFKLDKNGLIWFAALDRPADSPGASVVLHDAVLRTFLQHTDATKKKPSTRLNFGSEEEPLALFYQPVEWYYLQGIKPSAKKKSTSSATDLIVSRDRVNGTIGIKSFHWPGGGKRHEQYDESAIEEDIRRAFCLLYAPIGVWYCLILGPFESTRTGVAIVVPEISNLRDFARVRESLLKATYTDHLVSDGSEAALRFAVLSLVRPARVASQTVGAYVEVIGKNPGNKKQKARVATHWITRDVSALKSYDMARHVLAPRKVAGTTEPPALLALVARNLVNGRPWFLGFSEFVGHEVPRREKKRYKWLVPVGGRSQIKLWDIVIRCDNSNGGLTKMIERTSLMDQEQSFIRACHDALNQLWFELQKRCERERTSFVDLWERHYERTRVRLARCKNAPSVRQEVMDIWSRGKRNTTLQAQWQVMLPLFDVSNWARTRDLALLALASYRWPRRDGVEAEGDSQ